MTWSYALDKDFYACERGNTWLAKEDTGNHVAWFKLDDDHFLEVAVEPSNYPGFKVAVIEKPEAGLAKHINEKCQGWLVKKCNVPGVNVEDDYVAGDGPEYEGDDLQEEYNEGPFDPEVCVQLAAQTCQHTPDEDCLTCCECGQCSESLNEDDVCAECREKEANKPQ